MKKFESIKTKYFNLSIGLRAALWFTICNLLQKGISMITMPIFTRILTTEQYGFFTLYQSWYSIITIIVTLNLSGSLINNGMVKYENKRNEFISSMQGLSTTVTIFFFVVYLILKDFWNECFGLTTLFMLVMFLQLLFEPAYLFWAQKQRYEYKYKSLVVVTLLIAVSSPLLGVISVLSTNYKSEARIISFALVQACVGLIFYIIQGYRGKNFFNKEYWKFALTFNLPLIPHYLSQIVLGQSDRIMISKLVGNSEAAIYGVAYTLASVLTLFINALNSSFIPYIYENMKSKNYQNIKEKSDTLCFFMTIIVCVFMLFGPEAIAIFSTKEYLEAKWIFPPVVASVFFTYIYSLYINIEFYFEKTKYVMYVSICGALLNIILNYIFIKKYGFIAAGYTTVLCYSIFALGHYWLHKNILKKLNITNSVFNSKKILFYSIIILAFMFLSVFLYTKNTVRYIFIALIILTALILYKKIINQLKSIFNKKII